MIVWKLVNTAWINYVLGRYQQYLFVKQIHYNHMSTENWKITDENHLILKAFKEAGKWTWFAVVL